jgi:hypothetical protein
VRWSAVALAAALAVACSSRPSKSHCEKAVDHMLDIFVAPRLPAGQAVPAEASRDAEIWKKLLKEKDPVRGTLVETCQRKMSDRVAACVLEARDEATLAACFQ